MLLEDFTHCYKCDSLWKTNKVGITNCPFCNKPIDTPIDVDDFIIINGVLSKYIGNNTIVEVPDYVTTIGSFSFEGSVAETVILPNSVTTIEKDAFSWVETLTRIELPDTVTSIGAYAFEGCENLEYINIPAVATIHKNAFTDCTALPSDIIKLIQNQTQT